MDLLLDAAADVVDDGGGERDDMERFQDRAGVLELVIDDVLVPAEWVQCCYLDPLAECVAAILKPGPVGLTGAARDQVQQSRPGPQFACAVGVEGQVDHRGQLFRATPTVLDRLAGNVVPDVFVHAESGDALEPGQVLGRSLQEWLDRVPHRAPAAAKLTSDTVHGRVLATDLLDRPPSRPRRELRARCRDVLVLLDERPDRAASVRAQRAALAPPDPHRPAKRRGVDQAHTDPAMGVGDAPASSAAHRCRRRLHRDLQRVTTLTLDRDHAQPRQPDQQVALVAVAALRAVRSTLIHVEVLAIRRGRAPLILKGLDPCPTDPSTSARRPHPHTQRRRALKVLTLGTIHFTI